MGTAIVDYATLEHVAMNARPYPTEILEGCETGLCLFSAAFLGHNDAIHFAEAGLRTTCVDTNAGRLEEMSELYPRNWQWRWEDAWTFAQRAEALGWQWDAVSADTFTGDVEIKSLRSLDLWCSLARKALTVTLTEGKTYDVPKGWISNLYERAEGVYWLVLSRD